MSTAFSRVPWTLVYCASRFNPWCTPNPCLMKTPCLATIILTIIALQTNPSSAQRNSSLLTGTYTRNKHSPGKNQSAHLDITQISRSQIRFHLTALWWPVGNSSSPHNGEIEATIPLRNHVAAYTNSGYRLTLRFLPHSVVLTERGSNPDFGAYVSAAGIYRRLGRSRAKAGAR